jgi:hypothetical protein
MRFSLLGTIGRLAVAATACISGSGHQALAGGLFDFGFPNGLFDQMLDTSGPGMTRAQFREASAGAAQRCTNSITQGTCEQELQYARDHALISPPAYDWARANGFYPVIDRNDVVQAVCRCGCFAEDTAILGAAGWVPVQELERDALVASYDAANDAAAEQAEAGVALTPRPLASVISGPEAQDLYVFVLANGHELKLTQHHAVALSDGRMVAARDVGPQDAFLDYQTGRPVGVLAIERRPASGTVYNFEVAADDASAHVVVAEGVLVGDLAWQNQLYRELGAVAVRR